MLPYYKYANELLKRYDNIGSAGIGYGIGLIFSVVRLGQVIASQVLVLAKCLRGEYMILSFPMSIDSTHAPHQHEVHELVICLTSGAFFCTGGQRHGFSEGRVFLVKAGEPSLLRRYWCASMMGPLSRLLFFP
ncbi:MAG: hypothetical protein COB04_05365 [Gammaproteobacteria bacterium]|nr:MAG: hypothetical protein COB04_05365 [Gammaproteobacteria bacterium]